MQSFSEYLGRARWKHGSQFDPSLLDRRFVPYFESGERISVKFSWGEVKRGTIGVTTGWKPVFLLMRTSRSMGSSDTLGRQETIVPHVPKRRLKKPRMLFNMRRSVSKSSRFWWVWKGRVGQGMWPITAMPPRNAYGPFRTRKEAAMGMSTRNNPSSECVVCHGDLVFLGGLGNLEWFRCRACGMEQSRKAKARGKVQKNSLTKREAFRLHLESQDWNRRAMAAHGRGEKEAFAHAAGAGGAMHGVVTRYTKPKNYPPYHRASLNPIESTPGGGFVVTGKATQLYRLIALKHAMKLELTTGMKMSRGISPFAIVKQEFGFKGNKQKVFDQLVKYIEQVGPGLAQNPGGEFKGVKYWNVRVWNKTFGRTDFIAKVRATYPEIRKHFPGARVSRLDMLVGDVMVTKKSQVKVPAKVRK